MADNRKTKAQLEAEILSLRQTIDKLEVNGAIQADSRRSVGQEVYPVLLESATEGIILSNEGGKIELVNKRAEELFGYPREELLGEMIEVLIPQSLRPAHVRHRKDYARDPSPREMGQGRQLVGLRKDGTEIQLEVGLTYVKTANGVVVMSLIEDVTKRKRAEEALKKSHDQLRSLSAHLQSVREDERKRIARQIHDELGQALTALDIDVSWLSRQFKSEQRCLLQKTDSMAKLIRKALESVQKLSAKLRPPVLDDLGFAEAIRWEASEFEERTGVKVELSSDPEEVVVEGALKTTLFRVFQEALTNVARHAEAGNILVKMKKDAQKLELIVRDDGRGISREQVLKSSSMGLIGMQERLHPWKGDIEIDGVPGMGTTLSITVPMSRKIRVLIADDHLVVRQGLKQILAETADIVVVEEACDGFEVISKVWKNEYDVLLLDISMPGKNGLEVLEELKSLRPSLPVLVLSIHSDKQYALRALRAGAAGYLSKAGIQEDLIGAVRKIAQGQQYVTPDMAEQLVFDAIKPAGSKLHENLSNREFQVMCMLASGKTINDIAGELSLGKSTVSTLRARMLSKMKMKNNAEVTYYAIKEGLVK